jgi:hypothetical protein
VCRGLNSTGGVQAHLAPETYALCFLSQHSATRWPLTGPAKILDRSGYRHHLSLSRISATTKLDPPKGGDLTPHTRLLAKPFGIEALLHGIRQLTEQSPRT